MAALFVPVLLVRIFTNCLEKWNNNHHILTFVLNLIPIVGQIIYIIDIVYACIDRPFMLDIFDLNNTSAKKEEKPNEDKVVDVESTSK